MRNIISNNHTPVTIQKQLCKTSCRLSASVVLLSCRFVITAIMSASIGTFTGVYAQSQPYRNPHLANSLYPLGHGGSHQQDSLAVTGPVDKTRTLDKAEIQYTHTGPAFFGVYTSSPYPDGRRVLWGNGLDRIVKIDHDSHKVISTLMLENVEAHYDEAHADDAIASFDNNNDGFFALFKAFKEVQKLRSLASVYTLLDSNNAYFIANKSGFIEAYSDADANDPASAIVMQRRFDFPDEITGYSMGINMSYDGWLILVTEHGYLLALKPDFSEYRIARLQHAEGSKDKATRPTGGGWVRNAPAIDKDGGIYVASQEYMHKIIWTGDEFSVDERDGAWAVAYDNTWGHGTGATPSLMGFEGDDQLVVITDGNKRMNLVAYWRNSIPDNWQPIKGQDPRIAGLLPVTMGDQDLAEIQSEQSVIVEGYGALVVNNNPRNVPWYLPERASSLLISFLGSNPKHQPYGVQKFQWDPQVQQLKNAWVNNDVSSPSTVPIVSQLSSKVYLIGARDNQWTLESLDWRTGAEAFHYVIGGQRYNPFFSGTLLDEEGRVHYGSIWGRVRLDPNVQAIVKQDY